MELVVKFGTGRGIHHPGGTGGVGLSLTCRSRGQHTNSMLFLSVPSAHSLVSSDNRIPFPSVFTLPSRLASGNGCL